MEIKAMNANRKKRIYIYIYSREKTISCDTWRSYLTNRSHISSSELHYFHPSTQEDCTTSRWRCSKKTERLTSSVKITSDPAAISCALLYVADGFNFANKNLACNFLQNKYASKHWQFLTRTRKQYWDKKTLASWLILLFLQRWKGESSGGKEKGKVQQEEKPYESNKNRGRTQLSLETRSHRFRWRKFKHYWSHLMQLSGMFSRQKIKLKITSPGEWRLD